VWVNTVPTNLDGLERRFHCWRVRARRAAAGWAFRALPRLAGSALEIAAAKWEPAPTPHFFSTDVRQIDPTLNDDLLELYGRAGQVLANRFAFFNSPQAFDEGINWAPPQSPSWCAELHAFDYGLELACTFRISREDDYARQLRYLIAHWIASNPPGLGIGWQPHVVARRLRNWMLSADFARSDWDRDEEFGNLVAKSLGLQTAFLAGQFDSLPTPAARLDASRALLCAGRFFAGTKAREAYQMGFDLLASELAGARAEPWPHARLAKAQALMEWNLLSAGSADSTFLARELRAALDELEALLMPDGTLPLLGPEARLSQDELADLAALAAVRLESPAWKSVAGKLGILPYLYLGESGKARFESMQETVWAPQDHVNATAEILRVAGPQNSALVVSARLPASPEEHQDFTSYELTLNNYRVVVDSGGFAPEESEYFSRARAHNVLLVDGREPRWHCAESSARFDFQELPAGGSRLRMADPGFGFLGLPHERAWFRLENGAWVILDWLHGQGVHRCTNLLHFYPTLEIVAGDGRALAQSRACSFAVIPVGSAKPQASVSRGDHPQFPGWFSPEFGVRFPAAVLALDWAAVELPWLGGTLITSATDQPFRQLEIIPTEGRVRLEFSGKTYDLQMK
jgi:hypothetical protein